MLAVWKREFSHLCKGLKSLIVLGIFVGFSLIIANLINAIFSSWHNISIGQKEFVSAHSAGLNLLVLLLGYFFVIAVSYDTVNRELETKTIRLLVTKTSRSAIIAGKFLGVLSFWCAVITLSFLAISAISHSFDWPNYLSLLQFVCFLVGIVILLSTAISNPAYSLLVGILISLFYPALSLAAEYKAGAIWQIARYLSPYHYYRAGGYYSCWMLIPAGAGVVLLLIAILIFQRKDL